MKFFLHCLVAGFLLFPICALAEIRCTGTLTPVEKMVCESPRLLDLDKALNNYYDTLAKSLNDSGELKKQQKAWLSGIRNKCKNSDELIEAYNKRILQIYDLQIKNTGVNEEPLTKDEAVKICNELLELGYEKRLVAFQVPAGTCGDEKPSKSSDEESEISYSYCLKVSKAGPPTRLAEENSSGTCQCSSLYNYDIANKEKKSDMGIDPVNDTEDEIRWATIGGYEYPVFYKGRYFIISVGLQKGNIPRMISWIKPDGRIRPLCLTDDETVDRRVATAEDKKLCDLVASGDISPEKLEPYDFHQKAKSIDGFKELFIGKYADSADLIKFDIDGDGKAENIVRFEYFIYEGCSYTKAWLVQLSYKLDKAVKTGPVAELLAKIEGWPLNFYKYKNQLYVDTGDDNSGLVYIKNGKIEKACVFDPHVRKGISRFFDLDWKGPAAKK